MLTALYGHRDNLIDLINAGADANKVGRYNCIALHYAVDSNRYECLKVLLKIPGIHLNHRNRLGFTPLSEACQLGFPECVDLLIKAGADVNGPDKQVPALVECMCYSEKQLEQLAQDDQPRNFKKKECMEILIKAGAKVNVQDYRGSTALMKASENGCEDCVKLLLEAGADVNITSKEGHTALIYSVAYGRDACLDALIAAGVDVASQEVQGSTTLMCASANGHDNCVKYLIHAGVDVNFKDSKGCTALTQAAHFASFKCIETLLQLGADVNGRTKDQGTTLLIASMYNERKCKLPIDFTGNVYVPENHNVFKSFETLINAGADVNIKDNTGKVPLINVLLYDHEPCVPLLLAAGADVNITDKDSGSSALMIAIKKDRNETFDQLLEAGADVNIVNNNGNTALTTAAAYWWKNDEFVKRLLKANCRINTMAGMTENALAVHLRGPSSTNYITWPLVAAGEMLNGFRKVHYLLDFLTLDVRIQLKYICRETIRKHLLNLDPHSNLFGRVPLLGLPRVLGQYVLYNITLEPCKIFCDTQNSPNG